MFLKIINIFINNNKDYYANIDFYKRFVKLLLLNIHPNIQKRKSLQDTINYFNEIIKTQKHNIESFAYIKNKNIKKDLSTTIKHDTLINKLIKRSNKTSH